MNITSGPTINPDLWTSVQNTTGSVETSDSLQIHCEKGQVWDPAALICRHCALCCMGHQPMQGCLDQSFFPDHACFYDAECADPANIVPATEIPVPATTDDSVVDEPNWMMIGILAGSAALLLTLVIVVATLLVKKGRRSRPAVVEVEGDNAPATVGAGAGNDPDATFAKEVVNGRGTLGDPDGGNAAGRSDTTSANVRRCSDNPEEDTRSFRSNTHLLPPDSGASTDTDEFQPEVYLDENATGPQSDGSDSSSHGLTDSGWAGC